MAGLVTGVQGRRQRPPRRNLAAACGVCLPVAGEGRNHRGAMLDFLRGGAEQRYSLIISDPRPVNSVGVIWRSAAQIATIGIFILLLGAALALCRPLLLPVLTALV